MTSLKLAGYQTFLADRINIKFQWWANPNHNWDLNRDFNHFGNSIWDVKIWFKIILIVVIWFENFVIWYGKIFKLREIAIIVTHNGHFYRHIRTLYRCGKNGDHMEAVRQWLGTVVSEATVMIKYTSARLAACSMQQRRGIPVTSLNPYSLQTVGIMVHILHSHRHQYQRAPCQSLVTLWSAVHCNLISGKGLHFESSNIKHEMVARAIQYNTIQYNIKLVMRHM